MKQICNPYLPLCEYIPDGEPHVFGGRLYIFGSHDREMAMNSANWTMSATPPMPVTLRSGGMRALFTERIRIRIIRMAAYAFMRRMSVWDRMEGIISITA